MLRKRRNIPQQSMRDRIAGNDYNGPSNFSKWLKVVFIIVVVAGSGYFAISYIQGDIFNSSKDPSPGEEPAVSVENRDTTAVRENLPKEEEKPKPDEPEVIQVQVLNGCGASGVARKFTTYLREKGFDVVDTGNYENFTQKQTLVLDRSGNIELADRVAKSLNIENSIQQIAKELYLHVTVVIGSDYKKILSYIESK